MSHAVEVLKRAWRDARDRRRALVAQLKDAEAVVDRLEKELAAVEEEWSEYAGAVVAAGGGWTDEELK